MTETFDTKREGAERKPADMRKAASEVDAWFAREVLPLEAALMQFLANNWRNRSEVPDLLQEIYIRVYEAAQKQLPLAAKPFVFATARNLMMTLLRREQVVPIETVSDLEDLSVAADTPGPDHSLIARDELRRLQTALDHLPRRSREAFLLRQVEGLSWREMALRMGITEKTVKWHLNEGLRTLADILYRTSKNAGKKS